jgi:hypothetical protein
MPAGLWLPHPPVAACPTIPAGCQTADAVKISVSSARAVQRVAFARALCTEGPHFADHIVL